MTVAKAIAHAWSDAAFKDKLIRDPHAALAEHGLELPAGKTIKVIEDTDDTVHMVLPVRPAETGEFTLEKLEDVAGGLACYDTY